MKEMGEHIDGGNTLMEEMGEQIDEGDGGTH